MFICESTMEKNAYTNYFQSQSGCGFENIDFGPLYINPRYNQHGSGLGNFFASAFEYLRPLISAGIKAVKGTALKTGVSVLSEIGKRPIKEILLDHGQTALQDLGKKYKNKFQTGDGSDGKKPIKRRKRSVSNQLKTNTSTKKVKKEKLKKVNKNKIKKPVGKASKLSKKKKKPSKTRSLDIFS